MIMMEHGSAGFEHSYYVASGLELKGYGHIDSHRTPLKATI